jgi:hypothetical protein
MDCGRFLRADNYTAAKDRLDYARVLIATTAMAVIKKVENLMVDGSLVVVQIVEEWGYELGDDACLLEDDNVSKVSPAAENAFHCDPDACNQVDMLIDQIAKAVSDETHAQDDDAQPVKISVGSQSDEVAGRPRERDLGKPTPVLEPVVSRQEVADVSRNRVAETAMPLISPGPGQLGGSGRAPASPQMMAKVGMTKAQCQRTKSCPPADRSGVSGPWSLEWLDAHKIGAAGVLFRRRDGRRMGAVLWGIRIRRRFGISRRQKRGVSFNIQSVALKGLLASLLKIAGRCCKSCRRMQGNIDPGGQPVGLVRPAPGILLKMVFRPRPLTMTGHTG